MVVLDEYTRECTALEVGRKFTSDHFVEVLAELISVRGVPKFIRSDNGPELISRRIREFLAAIEVDTSYIELGSPWQNGYMESFNSRFRDAFLALEVFDNLQAAKILTGQWRKNYNEARPHSSSGFAPPSEFARQCSVAVAGAPSTEHCRNNTTNFNQPVLSQPPGTKNGGTSVASGIPIPFKRLITLFSVLSRN